MEEQWHTMFPGVNNFVFLGGAGSGKSECPSTSPSAWQQNRRSPSISLIWT